MSHCVALLSGGLGKTLSTVLALKWLLTSMDSLMRSKVPRLSELLRAETALEWLFSVVDAHMNLKRPRALC